MNTVKLHVEIEKYEEKFVNVNYRKTTEGTTYDRKSIGWYVQFLGSSESIMISDINLGWQPGDKVIITFERKPRG